MLRLVRFAAVVAVIAPVSLCAQQRGGGMFSSGGSGGGASQSQGSSSSSFGNFTGGNSAPGGVTNLATSQSGLGTSQSGSGGSQSVGGNLATPGSGLNGAGMAGRGAGGAGFEALANNAGGEFGQLGQNIANAGFIGANQNGFIGNRMVGQQTGQGFNQQMFQGLNRGSNSRNGAFGGADRPKLGVRPTLRIAFDRPTTTPTVATTRVSTRMTRIVGRRPELAGVTASTDDTGRVVLRGSVANDEARQLAAALVRLEPGVGEVVNELAVGSASAP